MRAKTVATLFISILQIARVVAQQEPPTDSVTTPPILAAPASNGSSANSIPVDFTLSEQALPGSVKLIFSGHFSRTLTLSSTLESPSRHEFSFDPTNPLGTLAIAGLEGGAGIPDGAYEVTLSYQDSFGNAASTASCTNFVIDRKAPAGGWIATSPGSPVGADQPFTMQLGGWTDANGPLMYEFFADSSSLGPPQLSSSMQRTFFAAHTYQLRGRIFDPAGNYAEVGPISLVVYDPPEAATGAATLVSAAHARLAGYVTTSVGTSSISFLYGTSFPLTLETPVISGWYGGGVDEFLSGLTPGTKYYFRVKAVNGAGTTLGDVFSFTTTPLRADSNPPILTVDSAPKGLIKEPFLIQGTVQDDTEVALLSVWLNGVPVKLDQDVYPVSGEAAIWSATDVVPENGPNVLTVEARDPSGNVSTKTIRFRHVSKRPDLAATYTALLIPAAASSIDNIGLVSLAVTNTGIFTGKVRTAGDTIRIRGIIANDGTARFHPLLEKTLALPGSRGLLTLSISENLELSGAMSSTEGGNLVASFAGSFEPRFSRKDPVPDEFLNQPVQGTRTKGYYTIAFPSKAQVPIRELSTYPQGAGIAAATLTRTGAISISGFLADGAKWGARSKLRGSGTAPLFIPLYNKHGCFAGELAFTNLPDSDVPEGF